MKEIIEKAKALINEIENFEIDPETHEDAYKEMIADCEKEVSLLGMKYSPSAVLLAIDPIAYHQGLLDYVDGLEVEDDPAYKELLEDLEKLKAELQDNIDKAESVLLDIEDYV